MKVIQDWEEDFGEYAEAVKKLLIKLGHTPEDLPLLKRGMRVKVCYKRENVHGVIMAFHGDDRVEVCIDYYTDKPKMLECKFENISPCINPYKPPKNSFR